MITHIRTVAVYVSDQTRALGFYRDQLGFNVQRKEPMGPDGNWIEVCAPGAQTCIVLYPRAMMKGWESMKPSIVFGIDDAEKTHRELKEKDVNIIDPPKKMPWGTYLKIADPDGNELLLVE